MKTFSFGPDLGPVPSTNPLTSDPRKGERTKYVDAILSALDLLRPHATDTVTVQVLDMLRREKIQTHRPKPGPVPGLLSVESCLYAVPHRVAVTFQSDGQAVAWLREVGAFEKGRVGFFMDELMGIVLMADNQGSEPVPGPLTASYLFHEKLHQFHPPTQGKIPATVREVAVEEVFAFRLQGDLIAGWGGDPYQVALTLMQEIILANLTFEKGITMPPPRADHITAASAPLHTYLSEAYGCEAVDEEQRYARASLAWTTALIRAFEAHFGEQDGHQKLVAFFEKEYVDRERIGRKR